MLFVSSIIRYTNFTLPLSKVMNLISIHFLHLLEDTFAGGLFPSANTDFLSTYILIGLTYT